MFERNTKGQIVDLLRKEFCYIQDQDFSFTLEGLYNTKSKSNKQTGCMRKPEEFTTPSNDKMTRKTRTRRPRIQALQSGYCAVCHIPYLSVEDHIQSKKHQKLIGEDANYIALNGFIQEDPANIHSFLKLNGIEAIGVNGDDFTGRMRRRTMRNTRASSVMCDKVKPSPLSPTGSEIIGHHHLRSRKYINYMTPPLDDDSLTGKSDLEIDTMPEPVKESFKEEKRTSMRLLAKVTDVLNNVGHEEVWNSGRPKRACTDTTNHQVESEDVWDSGRPKRACIRNKRYSIEDQDSVKSADNEEVWNSGRPKRSSCMKQKRSSADERLVTDNKTYYKVEVMSTKLRPNASNKEYEVSKRLQSPSSVDGEDKKKGLIVKFKKFRNSELIQLNTEAENFLFPKKDDSSSDEDDDDDDDDDEDIDDNGANTTASSGRRDLSVNLSSEEDDEEYKVPLKLKIEDDTSMDSCCSDVKKRKGKRRTHAEAFIMDNQKYYKFETPGSRLRYHGSYLPPMLAALKSPKNNGDCVAKQEKEQATTQEEKKNSQVNLGEYKFSFERVPRNEPWYSTFIRQDKGEMNYNYFVDRYHWDSFLLPYQIGPIPPLDPKTCLSHYHQIMKHLLEPSSTTTSVGSSTPDPSVSNSTTSTMDIPDGLHDEDSKFSATTTLSSTSTYDYGREVKGRGRKPKSATVPPSPGKNPRKSPRQHASTLAILSSLIHQRKKKRPSDQNTSKASLPTIPEEERRTSPGKPLKADYGDAAMSLEDELNSTVEDIPCVEEEADMSTVEGVDFHCSKVDVGYIMKIYEEAKKVENLTTARRFFNEKPGRKPGRKRKNRTGWPNRSKRNPRKEQISSKANDEDGSTVDSVSAMCSDDDDEDTKSTVSTTKTNSPKSSANNSKTDKKLSVNSKLANCDQTNDRVLQNNNAMKFQPYVCVQKLDGANLGKLTRKVREKAPRRTKRKVPVSPKSPRILRRPRGRWYRER